MTIKAILFDKDGTLIEFEKTWHKVFQNIFRKLQQGWQVPREKILRLQRLSGFTPRGFEKESLIQYAPVEEILNRWMEVLQQREGETAQQKITKEELSKLMEEMSKGPEATVVPLENTLPRVKALYHKGYLLGVATADGLASTLDNLEALGIRSCFSFIGSDDGYFKGKPDPHMGREFCKKFRLDPKEVLYVGDSLTDMLFAENAGFHFIGIKGEHNQYQRFLEKNYPVVKNIGEINEEMLTGG